MKSYNSAHTNLSTTGEGEKKNRGECFDVSAVRVEVHWTSALMRSTASRLFSKIAHSSDFEVCAQTCCTPLFFFSLLSNIFASKIQVHIDSL